MSRSKVFFVMYFSLGTKLGDRQTPEEGEKEKVRRLLPYWARELLRMWEEAERKHKSQKPFSQRAS